jgi:hypothetical protein
LRLVFEDKILDGRNRYRACELACVEPKFTAFEGTWEQALAAVVSWNLYRRHLNEGQRATAAAKAANMRQGARTDLASIDAMSQDDAAEDLNISRRSVQHAAKVLDWANPEQEGALPNAGAVAASMKKGELAPSAAVEFVALPREEQVAVLFHTMQDEAAPPCQRDLIFCRPRQ